MVGKNTSNNSLYRKLVDSDGFLPYLVKDPKENNNKPALMTVIGHLK